MSNTVSPCGEERTEPNPFPPESHRPQRRDRQPSRWRNELRHERRAKDPVAEASRREAAERSLRAAVERLGVTEHVALDLRQLLERTLGAGRTVGGATVAGAQALEAARLLELWVVAASGAPRTLIEIDGAFGSLRRLANALFGVIGGVRERPVLSDHQIVQAIADLARATGHLGPADAHRVAQPLVDGFLESRGLEVSDRFLARAGWRQLEKALITAIEEGAGSLLGIALLDAARREEGPNAAHFRDVVGAATADGAQALFRRFDELSRQRRELELRAGVRGFRLESFRPDPAAERALLRIEDAEGLVDRHEIVADRVRRTLVGLRTATEDAPHFTLEFGQGRLLEVAMSAVG